jgi:hypothetical protein
MKCFEAVQKGPDARRGGVEHRNVVLMPLEERSDERNKADGLFSTASKLIAAERHYDYALILRDGWGEVFFQRF